MAKRKAYEIAFVGLKPGIHEFTYEIDDKFFAGLETREFSNCFAKVKLSLDKKSSFMMLRFEVGGKADVLCDRCSNSITIDLWDEFNMLVKMVENPEQMNEQEEDPDVFYISKTESHLHLNNWLFEFVSLSVPAQKTCSPEAFGGPGCNKEVLDMLKKMETTDSEATANDIWKGLEQFRKSEQDPNKEN
ncbi:MAG TPA: YceD family protein [Ferruginibacter sp.]|nr:YceD family protein [Ferruginibacter sp.]HMP22053.1 YceD family protein [Ferruginibacter sp.]